MATLVFSIALLSFLVVHVEADACWKACPVKIQESLNILKPMIGDGPLVMHNVSICSKLTINNICKGLKAHPDCAMKDCDGGIPECKDQRFAVEMTNITFKCEIDKAGDLVKELMPTMKISKDIGKASLEGCWSKFVMVVVTQLDDGKDTVKVTSTELRSDDKALSMTCSGTNFLLNIACKSLSKNTDSCLKLGKLAQGLLKQQAPAMISGLGDTLADITCE